MSSDSDFNNDLKRFIQMLKKMLRSHVGHDRVWDKPEKNKNGDVNVNVFIFPLIPMSPEEMDEFEEIYENFLSDEDSSAEDLTAEITDSDLDFLRRNGIRY